MPSKSTGSADVIILKGIRAKGYGQISKLAMIDPDLSVEAKGILAYFCSYCGGGNTAFPGRDKIVHDLRINKDTYYKHLKSLISNGYISVEQQHGDAQHPGFKHNVYSIENYPEKYALSPAEAFAPLIRDSVKKVQTVRDIYAAGYGIIPKTVMLDNLTIQAKGLYAYLCAFSGQDFSAAPSRDIILAHLQISHNSSNKYMQELCVSSYITKVQAVSNGRFAGFIYYLNQDLAAVNNARDSYEFPQPKISDTSILDREPTFSDTQLAPQPSFSDTRNSDTQNQDTNTPNVNKPNYNTSFMSQSIFQNTPSPTSVPKYADDRLIDYNKAKYDILDDIIAARTLPYRYMDSPLLINAALKALTDWELRITPAYYQSAEGLSYVRMYRGFISALTDMLTSGHYTLIRGAQISYAMVYQLLVDNFLSISNDSADLDLLPDICVESCMDMCSRKKISNIEAYMKTVIWTQLKDAGSNISCDNNLDA